MLSFSTFAFLAVVALGSFPYITNFEDSGLELCYDYNSMGCYYDSELSSDLWILGGLQPDNEGNAVLTLRQYNFESQECTDYTQQTEWFTNFITGVEVIGGKAYYNHYESDYIASFEFSTHATTREAGFLNNILDDNFNLVITGNNLDTIYVSGGNLNVFWMWTVDTCYDCMVALNEPNNEHYWAPMEYYNGYVYIFGGNGTTTIERFDTSNPTGSWETLDAEFLTSQAQRQSYVLGDSGLIYIFGVDENVYYFNTIDNTLTYTDITLPNDPSRPCIVEYMNRLLIIGGENENGQQILQSNEYDLNDDDDDDDMVLDLEISIKSRNYFNNSEIKLNLETEGEFTAEEVCMKVFHFYEEYH